ncbi:MAG TPA: hypothetical protein VGO13_08000 [Solirubrobacterales bacterium]|nr:hypothetical protein [Solirubrobacterales bacterium]
MSWGDDVAKAVMALIGNRTDIPLNERLESAHQVEKSLPEEPGNLMFAVRELLAAARFTARGITPVARARLASALPLVEVDAILGWLVCRTMMVDPERKGEAHELLLRLIERYALDGRDDLALAPLLLQFDDYETSAVLMARQSAGEQVTDVVWRSKVLMALCHRSAALEMLVSRLENPHLDIYETLRACGVPIQDAIRGQPESARRVLEGLIGRLEPGHAIPSLSLETLFTLLDEVKDEVTAGRLIERIVAGASAEDYVDWALSASYSEFQGASGAIAHAGYIATGDQVLADLAVWRLVAAGQVGSAIEIAVSVPWDPGHQRLRELFERCLLAAVDKAQIERLVGRAGALGIELEDRDPVISHKFDEVTNALVVKELSEGRLGHALELAHKYAFLDRSGVAARSIWVDFHLELGQLNEALELAERLRASWPDHPMSHLKTSQSLAWLQLEEEEREAVDSGVRCMARFPPAAPEILKRLAVFDRDEASAAIAAALSDESFADVHDQLAELRAALRSGAG